MDEKVQNLITNLITQILQTSNEKIIQKNMIIALTQINAPLQGVRPKNILFWEKKWKKDINQTLNSRLTITCKKIIKTPLPIFTVLNLLKKTQHEVIMNPILKQNEKVEIKSVNILSEQELVSDMLALLQGGQGNRITIDSGQIKIDGLLLPPHRHIVSYILKAIFCLNIMTKTISNIKGIVGQAIAEKIQKERREFIIQLASSANKKSSLLSLYAYVCGSRYERLSACAWISSIINQESEEPPLNTLSLSQNHGNPFVQSIGRELIKSGIEIYIEFIKEWVVYGFLEDPYGEFFIAKSSEKIESWDWWNSKYIVVSNRIPNFLVDEHLISKIVSSGRAWNFIRKYRSLSADVETEGKFNDEKFEIKHVEQFSKQSMKNVLIIIKDYVWISGHIKALNDFILFFRGDFSSSLYRLITNEKRTEGTNILFETLQSVTNGTSYTNTLTQEKLIDRLDFQLKPNIDQTNIQITYNVESPLDSLLDPDSLDNYYALSKLIWKLKCAEFHLNSNWKQSKRPIADFVRGYEHLARIQNIVRHSMLTTVRALNEFISTDVVLSSCQHFNDYLSKANDFDDILKQHRNHINSMMRNTLMTNEYIHLQNAISDLLEVINNFNDLELEIELKYDTLLDKILENDDFESEVDRSSDIANCISDITAAAESFSSYGNMFNEKFAILYNLAAENPGSIELQRLELRLLFCKTCTNY